MPLSVVWSELRPSDKDGEYSIKFEEGQDGDFGKEIDLFRQTDAISEDTHDALSWLTKGAVQSWTYAQASALWKTIVQAELTFNKTQKQIETAQGQTFGTYKVSIAPKYGWLEWGLKGGTPQLTDKENKEAFVQAQKDVATVAKDTAKKVGDTAGAVAKPLAFGVGAMVTLFVILYIAAKTR